MRHNNEESRSALARRARDECAARVRTRGGRVRDRGAARRGATVTRRGVEQSIRSLMRHACPLDDRYAIPGWLRALEVIRRVGIAAWCRGRVYTVLRFGEREPNPGRGGEEWGIIVVADKASPSSGRYGVVSRGGVGVYLPRAGGVLALSSSTARGPSSGRTACRATSVMSSSSPRRASHRRVVFRAARARGEQRRTDRAARGRGAIVVTMTCV